MCAVRARDQTLLPDDPIDQVDKAGLSRVANPMISSRLYPSRIISHLLLMMVLEH